MERANNSERISGEHGNWKHVQHNSHEAESLSWNSSKLQCLCCSPCLLVCHKLEQSAPQGWFCVQTLHPPRKHHYTDLCCLMLQHCRSRYILIPFKASHPSIHVNLHIHICVYLVCFRRICFLSFGIKQEDL